MRLKRISLRNYRQHRELDVDFTGHMVAVLGKNGSGKSNFLGAIQFALTGEQPGFNKEDLLNWEAAKSNEGGYVDLEFVHNGQDCRIQRRIEKPAVTLTVGDEKFSGTKKVQEQMELMGIDKDVLRQSVFVRQTEVESVLFDDPRERELAFQKLVGLGDAAKHNKFLTDFLAALAEPKSLDDEIDRQKESIETQKKALSDLEVRSAELGAALAKAGDDESIRKEVEVLCDRASSVANAMFKMDALDAAKKAYESVLSRPAKSFVDTSGIDAAIEDAQARISASQQAGARNEERCRKAKALADAEAGLAAIPDDWESKVEQVRDVSNDVTELRGRVAQLDKLLKDAPDGNVCPLCGSTTDHNIREEIQRERDDVLVRGREMSKWLADNSFVLSWPQKRAALETAVSSARAEIERLGAEEEVEDIQKLVCLKQASVEARKAAESSNAAYHAAQAELAAAKSAFQRASDALSEARGKLPGNLADEQFEVVLSSLRRRNEELVSALDELSILKAQKAELDGGISQVRAFIAEAEKGLVDLERVNAENRVKARKIQVVRDVKDWFSYKNGPRVMSQAVMGLLVDETNRFLGQFGSPFTVIPIEEGMGFLCVFTDGRVTSEPPPEATMLSGGQKIALAVAFRFAVYTMFSGKLGLLSLDEPTAYLDDETIARFADLLGKVREIAVNSDLQVLISTHEAQLGPVFDQTVEIGR